MNFLAVLLRAYSYLFWTVICLLTLGISSLKYLSGSSVLLLSMVPYTGDELAKVLWYSSVIGLICVLLAVTGIFRYAFPVWCLIGAVQLFRWFALPGTTFQGLDEMKGAFLLVLGAVGAFLSALQLFKSKERLRRERGLMNLPAHRRSVKLA